MKLNKYISILITASAFFGACSDWTQTESLDIRYPSFEEQNPVLYAKYLEELRNYKESEHKLTFVMMENAEGASPTAQNQRLTAYPDSVDFICMTHATNLADEFVREIPEVQRKGTRILFDIDYLQLQNAWEASVETTEIEQTDNDAESSTVADDTQFLAYCRERTEALLADCDRYGFDGVVFSYDGPVLSSLSSEELALLTTRMSAFTAVVKDWGDTHPDKLLFFRGTPQTLPDRSLLSDCSYIIVSAPDAVNEEELTIAVLNACVEDVPEDRFLIGVTTPVPGENDSQGWFSTSNDAGTPLYAMLGAAGWVMQPDDFIKAGIAIDRAWNDYYDSNMIFPNIRNTIYTMNPVPKTDK